MRDKIIDTLLKLKVPCKTVGFDNAVVAIECLISVKSQTDMCSVYNFIASNTGRSSDAVVKSIRRAFSKINTESDFYKRHFDKLRKDSSILLFIIAEKIRKGGME